MTENTDWDALLDERLSESRRRQRDEAQAAEPPPGPEAAEQVLDRIRTAAENGEIPASEAAPQDAPPPPGEAPARPYVPPPPPPPRPRERPPGSRREGPVAHSPEAGDRPQLPYHHRHRLNSDRLKQAAFWLLLLVFLAGGILLTFWPQLLEHLRLGEKRVTPPISAPKENEPAPPRKEPDNEEPGLRIGPYEGPTGEPGGELPAELPKEDPPPAELWPPEGSKPKKPEKEPPPVPKDVPRIDIKLPELPKLPAPPRPFNAPDPWKITPPRPPAAPRPPAPPKPKKKASKPSD